MPAAGATDSDHDGLTDTFETTWSHTDPHKADTNGNGVLDSAEDPDGEGLSNLGEQRFGTDPLNPDTDRDGVRDGQEDANGNGISNAKEQDRRPVPSHLVPSLAAAPGDTPVSYADHCHSLPYDSHIHPCVYGDPNGHLTIALFGDSHAEQWLPGMIPPAKAHGWRIVTLTKSACPAARVNFAEPNFPGDQGPCNHWRRRAIAWIGSHLPDVVLLTSSRGYTLIDGSGHPLFPAQTAEAWKQGLEDTLGRLPGASKAIVLADTPRFGKDVPLCLSKHPNRISACVTPRSHAIDQLHVDAEKQAAADKGATFANLNDVVCPYDPCPVIVGHFVMWRNGSHLTATYAKQLSPSVHAMLSRVVSSAAPGLPVSSDLEMADVATMMGPGNHWRD
jgi:hypothetical protein